MKSMLLGRFELAERGSDLPTELRAGLVTFLTMAYILVVNSEILSAAGLPRGEVVFATAVASAVACLVMGLWANYPFALAPGMGLNAYFAFAVVGGMGVDWQVALGCVFVAGLIFVALSAAGLRKHVLAAIPESIKLATTAGIGLFLALIGLQNAGVVIDHPVTLLTLGPLTEAPVLLSLAGLVIMAVLLHRRVTGALLIGIGGVTAIAWLAGLAPPPEGIVSPPVLPTTTLLAFDLVHLTSTAALTAIVAFLFVDLFDTAGTLIGVGRLGGFTDDSGDLPGADRAFLADAVGTTVGAALGTSPVTTYIESATGIEEGGRTGLTAVTVALPFLGALVLTPIFVAVPAIATAPALLLVGALMMQTASEIDWKRLDEGVPAFLTVALMPFTYSIAHGISAGVVSFVIIKALSGEARQVHPLLYGLAVALTALYGLLLTQ